MYTVQYRQTASAEEQESLRSPAVVFAYLISLPIEDAGVMAILRQEYRNSSIS